MYAKKTDYDDIEMSSRLRNMDSDLMTSYVWMHLEWG